MVRGEPTYSHGDLRTQNAAFWSADHTTRAAHLVRQRLGALGRVTGAFKLLTPLVHVTDGLGDGEGKINTAILLKLRPLCISRINAWTW